MEFLYERAEVEASSLRLPEVFLWPGKFAPAGNRSGKPWWVSGIDFNGYETNNSVKPFKKNRHINYGVDHEHQVGDQSSSAAYISGHIRLPWNVFGQGFLPQS